MRAGHRVVELDRRKDQLVDEGGVVAKFGVRPTSIPDYLALVGDSADGFPGLAGWGAKSAAAVLARWEHLEDIPADSAHWDVAVRGAAKLAATLQEGSDDAVLFKELATLRIDRSLLEGRRTFAGTARRASSPASARRSTRPAPPARGSARRDASRTGVRPRARGHIAPRLHDQ